MNEHDFLSQEIRADEEVLWRGQPELTGKGVQSKGANAITGFGLFALAFATFWTYTAARTAGIAFALFALPFFAVALYMTFGMRIKRKKTLANTQYAVTNKRIIIVSNGKIKTMALSDIPCIEKQYFPDGNGTVSFDPPEQGYTAVYNHKARMSPTVDFIPYAFENIRDCSEVARIVEDAKANASR